MNDDPFLISKDGTVWACWLNGKPAVNLGNEQNFWVIAEKLFNELHPDTQPTTVTPNPAKPEEGGLDVSALHQAERKDRDEPRFELTLIGRLYGVGGSREVTIFDLSTRGCRVKDLLPPKTDAIVTIKIGTVGPIEGVIRWRRGDFVGIMFKNHLHPAVLDNIKEKSLR